MDDATVTRRRLLMFGAGAATLLAAACKKGEPSSCNDTSGLSADELNVRTTLAYVDRSTLANQMCELCQQYVPGSPGECGSCKVLKGPVHPKGYCKAFAAK